MYFLILPFISISQDNSIKSSKEHNIEIKDLKIYYDIDGKECLRSDAKYYREIKVDRFNLPLGEVKDFYINGNLQWVGNLKSWDRSDWSKDIKYGLCTSYYINGKKEHEATYKNNEIDGESKYWNENGNLIREENYSNGKLNGIIKSYYPNGNLHYEEIYRNGIPSERYLECSERNWCRMVFLKKLNDTEFNTSFPFDDLDNDYSIELSLDLNSNLDNSFISLFWGGYNYSNGYYLTIFNRQYRLVSVIEDIEVPLSEYTNIERNYRDNIRLKIIQNQGMTFVSIDGDVIFYFADNETGNYLPLQGSHIGFLTENMTCKYLKIEEFNQSDSHSGNFTGNTGTGFAINRNGYIATNYHVIEDVDEGITVTGINGQFERKYNAEIVDLDKANDLAILKINSDLIDIPYSINTNDNIVTQEVYAYGFPLTDLMGNSMSFTKGIVNKNTGMGDDIRFLQHEATLQPGNSGGPLFDKNGNVVGINTLTVNKGYEDYIGVDVENVFYSLKSKYLIDLMRKNNLSFSRRNILKGEEISNQYEYIKDYIYFIEVK